MLEHANVPGLETRVRVYRGPVVQGRAQLLGFAELVIGGCFVIKDIRILKAASEKNGESVFVAFPSRQKPGEEKQYYDVAHPVTAEAYQEARRAIMRAYEEACAKA